MPWSISRPQSHSWDMPTLSFTLKSSRRRDVHWSCPIALLSSSFPAGHVCPLDFCQRTSSRMSILYTLARQLVSGPPTRLAHNPLLHQGQAELQFQNQLAAFPSLHFGYSFVIGLSLWAYSPHKIVRIIAPAYPVLILLVIMVSLAMSSEGILTR